jgi:mono/diheme cytochrome c family protein
MKTLLRWTAIVLGSLVALLIVAYGVLYVMSERILKHDYDVPAVRIEVPTDPASIAEGKRLATFRGCYGACHGKEAEGGVLFDQPIIGRIVAPNLTASVRQYTDPQLAVIIRTGIRPDGHSVMVMPSEAFAMMTDEDVGKTIAFLKSLKPLDGPGPELSLGPLGRLGVVTGQFRTAAQLIADTVPPPEAKDSQAGFGRYLARTVCSGCHGSSLAGDSNPDFTSPDLRIVGGYSLDQFRELLRTGVALGGRNLRVMSPTAKESLSQLNDAEIAALYAYLHGLAKPN